MKIASTFHSLTKASLVATCTALAVLGGACGSSDGNSSPDGGGGDTGGSADPAKYGFETDVQGWASTGALPVTDVGTSAVQKAAGAKSLVGTITATEGSTVASYVLELVFSGTLPTIAPGSKATFHVYVPTGAAVNAVQPYINESDMSLPEPYRWTGAWTATMPGMWQTIEVTAPADVTPLQKVGVQFFVSAAWTGQVYVDSVDWK